MKIIVTVVIGDFGNTYVNRGDVEVTLGKMYLSGRLPIMLIIAVVFFSPLLSKPRKMLVRNTSTKLEGSRDVHKMAY